MARTVNRGLQLLTPTAKRVRAVLVTFLILGAATFFYRGFSYSRAVVLLMIPLVLTGSVIFRAGARFLWLQVLRLEPVQGAALLVGTGPIARQLAWPSRRSDRRGWPGRAPSDRRSLY